MEVVGYWMSDFYLIDFNSISTYLGLFNAKRLENHVHIYIFGGGV